MKLVFAIERAQFVRVLPDFPSYRARETFKSISSNFTADAWLLLPAVSLEDSFEVNNHKICLFRATWEFIPTEKFAYDEAFVCLICEIADIGAELITIIRRNINYN